MGLLLLCAALYLPGFFTIPAIDRDEARFAQASRQMAAAESWHGWVVPMVQERPRLQKPPLIYWLQATAARLCTDQFRGRGAEAVERDSIWMYRIPSLLSALVTVIVVWRWAAAAFAPRIALLAGVLMAVNPLMFWETRQARADMLLLACTAVAMWAGWEVVRRARFHRSSVLWVVTFWAAVSLGTLAKGPITPMVAVLGVLVHAMVRGEWRWVRIFRPVVGGVLALAPIGLWVWLVSREIDLSVYAATIRAETIGRASAAMEGHGGPAGYHAVVMYLMFLPGCMVVALGVWRAVRRGFSWWVPRGFGWWAGVRAAVGSARASSSAECYLLCVLVPGWLIFEVSGTKLPHYALPLYPVLALLAARAVYAGARLAGVRSARVGRLLWVWAAGVVAFCLAVGAFVAMVPQSLGLGWTVLAVAMALGGAAAMAWVAVKWVSARGLLCLQTGSLGAVGVSMATFGLVAGSIADIRVSRELAGMISAEGTGGRPIAAVGWHEDSLIFETRGRSRRIDEWKLKAWLAEHDSPERRALIVMERERFERWPPMREVGAVKGFNYSNGKRVDLVVAEMTR